MPSDPSFPTGNQVPYRYADLAVYSAVTLPELPEASGEDPEVVRVDEPDTSGPMEVPPEAWIHHWRQGGETVLSLARTGQGYLYRFPGLADFLLSGDGTRITPRPEPEADPATLRHLLLDQVLPRLLARRDRLVVHAAAVDSPRGAIVFLGPTGGGKSTLAAHYLAAGFPLLADDCLLLEPGASSDLSVRPAYRSLRLGPEGIGRIFPEPVPQAPMADYSDKQRVLLPGDPALPALPRPAAAFYLLASPPPEEVLAITIGRLSRRQACLALIENVFAFDPTDRTEAGARLEAAGEAAVRLPIFSLTFPRRHAMLASVRVALRHHLEAKAFTDR